MRSLPLRRPHPTPPSRGAHAAPMCLLLAMWSTLVLVLPDPAGAQRGGRSPRRGEEFTLYVGEQTTLPTDGVVNYSAGNQEVIQVALTRDKKRFVVKALQEGESTLLLIYQDGRQTIHRFVVRQRRERDRIVKPRENIRLDLYFVELRRNASLRLGIGWPTSIGTEVALAANFNFAQSSYDLSTSVAANVLPKLDLLHATGWAKVRRHAAIVTANGERASFRSGGEIYIVVTGVGAAQLQNIPYGASFEVTPRYDAKTGRIEVQIQADLSELGASYQSGGPPSRLLTQAQSLVNLRLGEAIVLGGIRGANQNHARNGLPGLSQIPILGILFGQHTWESSETESVLVILPTVREEPTAAHRERIGEALGLYRLFEGDFDEVGTRRLFPPPPGTPGAVSPTRSTEGE